VRTVPFLLISLVVGGVVFAGALAFGNEYVFFAGYVVLQYVVLSTAWNILGGYCGYVNFGTAAFFALGAYSTVAIYKLITEHDLYRMPMPVLLLIGGAVSAVVGFGMGYLTLRLRGAFFAIATLALAVVLQTLVVNWDYVGGSRGAYILRPDSFPLIGSYIRYLFLIMMLLAIASLTTARLIERSRLGYGFATIRDDELAAEALGVPTLRLKLIATTISGALMGMAGAPYPYYIGYLQPDSTFGLEYAVNSIAMPLIGGTTSWVGPLIGAVLLGSLQQIATVTISSAANLLIVGLLLVDFVIIAPNGIVGLVRDRRTTAAALAEPALFTLIYIINLLPMYFLMYQGGTAEWIALFFWAFLFFAALARGWAIGRRWLFLFPFFGALVGQVAIAYPSSSLTFVSAAIHAIGILCGLITNRRLADAPS
jgi:branched-chain amino acid transport system permease protein